MREAGADGPGGGDEGARAYVGWGGWGVPSAVGIPGVATLALPVVSSAESASLQGRPPGDARNELLSGPAALASILVNLSSGVRRSLFALTLHPPPPEHEPGGLGLWKGRGWVGGSRGAAHSSALPQQVLR
jgi:hypothetical protein